MAEGTTVEAHDAAPGEVEHTEDLGVDDWWPWPGDGVLGPVTVPAAELVENRFSRVARWKRPGRGGSRVRAKVCVGLSQPQHPP